jgi:hypothetical protein
MNRDHMFGCTQRLPITSSIDDEIIDTNFVVKYPLGYPTRIRERNVALRDALDKKWGPLTDFESINHRAEIRRIDCKTGQALQKAIDAELDAAAAAGKCSATIVDGCLPAAAIVNGGLAANKIHQVTDAIAGLAPAKATISAEQLIRNCVESSKTEQAKWDALNGRGPVLNGLGILALAQDAQAQAQVSVWRASAPEQMKSIWTEEALARKVQEHAAANLKRVMDEANAQAQYACGINAGENIVRARLTADLRLGDLRHGTYGDLPPVPFDLRERGAMWLWNVKHVGWLLDTVAGHEANGTVFSALVGAQT